MSLGTTDILKKQNN